MQFETYYNDPGHEFTRLLDFVGATAIHGKPMPNRAPEGFKDIDELTAAATIHINSKHKAKLSNQITEEHKSELREIFRPHNKLLDELLGYKTWYPS